MDVGVAIDVVVVLGDSLPKAAARVSTAAPLDSAIAVIARDFITVSALDLCVSPI
ncbi:hypothetical protein [Mycobacterium seoulense]|uniref:hypothetical protein n=1 Tax=Mycobacterium seoulense TaxID=386911 RepID=UPI0013D2BA0A|nr:hypothetical protein [Mycobacterium seoulense]MCV7439175.1 hypothetical protein [Mycobacterium seoulense]